MAKFWKKLVSCVMAFLIAAEAFCGNSVIAAGTSDEAEEHAHVHEDESFQTYSIDSDTELECYEPGNVDGTEGVTESDVIYALYHYVFGDEEYPLSQDCDFNNDKTFDNNDIIYLSKYVENPDENPLRTKIHSYYGASWQLEDLDAPKVTLKCACGEDAVFTNQAVEGVTDGIKLTSKTVTEAGCLTKGSKEVAATIEVYGKEYTYSEEIEIPATGHKFAEDGEESLCEGERGCINDNCDYTEVNPGHVWGQEPTETTAATCIENGEEIYTCSQCEETKSVVLEAVGHVWDYESGKEVKAKTGDKQEYCKNHNIGCHRNYSCGRCSRSRIIC